MGYAQITNLSKGGRAQLVRLIPVNYVGPNFGGEACVVLRTNLAVEMTLLIFVPVSHDRRR